LAQAAGIDPEDDQAVRKFDRKRPGKKLSNEQFKNRHDPDAEISRGAMRKAMLRGRVNLQKRYVFAAGCYNLSQMLRKKFTCGTLKMALAPSWARLLHDCLILIAHLARSLLDHWPALPSKFRSCLLALCCFNTPTTPCFSTVC
jgi:hypothetical protein